VFDTLDAGTPMTGSAAPQGLADQMHQAWVAFGRTGSPGWRPWTPEDRAVMVFDVDSGLTVAPRADELALWA
jgi:para-nitrobenzyl esterase